MHYTLDMGQRRGDNMHENALQKSILFSPVGSTDPVSRNVLSDGSTAHYDGSMIHICRQYKPEQVVLYLSEEMRRFEEDDRRYTESLDLLGEKIGHEFVPSFEPGCFISEDRFVTEAQDYDTFYNDFEEILRALHREYPDYKILINVSSGTPAMKTALYLLANFLPFKTYPIQVSTPLKRSNRTEWLLAAGGVREVWQANRDNGAGEMQRCVDVSYENLSARLIKHSIKELVDAYDYSAALVLAREIEDYVSDKAIAYLEAAVKRVEQRWSEITDVSIVRAFELPKAGSALSVATGKGFDEGNPLVKAFQQSARQIGEDGLECGDEYGALIEYLLWLQMKQRRGDYADFIRGLTPVLFALMQLAVDDLEGLHIEAEGCGRNGQCVPKFDAKKVSHLISSLRMRGLLNERLERKLLNWGEIERTLDSKVYIDIIETLKSKKPQSWFGDLEKLRAIEQSARHRAAHEINGVDEGWIERSNHYGYSSCEILELIKQCAGSMRDADGQKVLVIDWKSYDKMNVLIKAEL